MKLEKTTQKYIKIIGKMIIGIGVIGILFLVIMTNIFGPFPITEYKMSQEFKAHKDKLSQIEKYLEREDYENIAIRASDNSGEMFANDQGSNINGYVKISNEEVANLIVELFKDQGYSLISKEENGVYFQRWANLDKGRGVVFSIDGKAPRNERLTILEPIFETDWYFYEEE